MIILFKPHTHTHTHTHKQTHTYTRIQIYDEAEILQTKIRLLSKTNMVSVTWPALISVSM